MLAKKIQGNLFFSFFILFMFCGYLFSLYNFINYMYGLLLLLVTIFNVILIFRWRLVLVNFVYSYIFIYLLEPFFLPIVTFLFFSTLINNTAIYLVIFNVLFSLLIFLFFENIFFKIISIIVFYLIYILSLFIIFFILIFDVFIVGSISFTIFDLLLNNFSIKKQSYLMFGLSKPINSIIPYVKISSRLFTEDYFRWYKALEILKTESTKDIPFEDKKILIEFRKLSGPFYSQKLNGADITRELNIFHKLADDLSEDFFILSTEATVGDNTIVLFKDYDKIPNVSFDGNVIFKIKNGYFYHYNKINNVLTELTPGLQKLMFKHYSEFPEIMRNTSQKIDGVMNQKCFILHKGDCITFNEFLKEINTYEIKTMRNYADYKIIEHIFNSRPANVLLEVAPGIVEFNYKNSIILEKSICKLNKFNIYNNLRRSFDLFESMPKGYLSFKIDEFSMSKILSQRIRNKEDL